MHTHPLNPPIINQQPASHPLHSLQMQPCPTSGVLGYYVSPARQTVCATARLGMKPPCTHIATTHAWHAFPQCNARAGWSACREKRCLGRGTHSPLEPRGRTTSPLEPHDRTTKPPRASEESHQRASSSFKSFSSWGGRPRQKDLRQTAKHCAPG